MSRRGGEVLVGTARWEREMQLDAERERKRGDAERQRALLELAEAEIHARVTALQHELEARCATSACA